MRVKWKELPWNESTLEPMALAATIPGYAPAKRQFDRAITHPHDRRARRGEWETHKPHGVSPHIAYPPRKDQLDALEWMMARYKAKLPFIINCEAANMHPEQEGALYASSVVMHPPRPGPSIVLIMVSTPKQGKVWADELLKTTPELNVIEYTGSKAEKETMKSCGLLLNTKDRTPVPKFDVLIVLWGAFRVTEDGVAEVLSTGGPQRGSQRGPQRGPQREP